MLKHRPTMDQLNRVFMGAVMGGGPLIGSAVSFLMAGAFMWAIVRLIRRDFPLARIREVRIAAAAFAIYVLVRTVAELLSYRGVGSLWEIVTVLPFLSLLPIYSRLAVSNRHDTRDAIEIGAVVTAFPGFFWALYQVMAFGMRAEGGAGNAGPFATVCLVVCAICLLAALRHGGARQYCALAAAVLSAGAVVLSGMRSLWPALLLLPLVISFIVRRDVDWKRMRLPLAAAAVLILLVLLGLSDLIARRVLLLAEDYERLVELGDHTSSLGFRITMWKTGWDLFLEAPIFGHGGSNLEALLSQTALENYGRTISYSHFHNAFLTQAVRAGLVGVAALAMLFVVPITLAVRGIKDEIGRYGLALLASVYLIYLLGGLFGIMLGHDIQDFVFIASTITGLFLVFGRGPATDAEPVGSRTLP